MGGFTSLIGGYVPTVGDEVVLRARVSEFFNLTQLTSASRLQVIEHGLDVSSAVEVTDAVPPADLAVADRFWERHEGARMRVRAGSAATSGRDVFGSTADAEAWLVDVDDPLLDGADPHARRVFRDPHPLDNNPDALFDDGKGARIMLGSLGLKWTASEAAYRAHLEDIAVQIVTDLHAPDLLLMQEAEDQDIGTVTAGTLACGALDAAAGKPDTLQEVELAIAAAGGPAYDAAYDRDGGDDRGIVSAFLYRTDRLSLPAPAAADPVLGATPGVVYRAPGLAYSADVQNPKALNADLPSDVDTSTGVDGSDVYTRAPQVARFFVAAGPGADEGYPL